MKSDARGFAAVKLRAKRRSLLTIALIVTAVIPVYAQQYDSEKDFEIDWDPKVKGGVLIAEYIGSKREVRIPPSIQNNPVTGIGERAFFQRRSLTGVTIPNSVTGIGYSAFWGCTSLKSVTIPNSVTGIGDEAFSRCTSLASITIPNSVTGIGEGTFYGCTSLKSITIPNSVTSIGNWAFSRCNSLTSVTFQGKISFDRVFDGNLDGLYLASDGGPGTYTRFAKGKTWKKQ